MKAPPVLRLSQWAEEHFYLSAESSYGEQRWRCYPFQRAVMDCISHDDIREVVFKKSARVGYTKMVLAAIGYFAQHKRRNQGIWQPTDEDSDDFVKTDVDTMLRDVPILQSVFPKMARRDSDNTLRSKRFIGSTTHFRGATAARSFRRLSLDVAYLDELDGMPRDVQKEGAPPELARKRLEGATFPKLVMGSTPKLKGYSLIEDAEATVQRLFRFHVPCPECGVEHPLTWGGKDKAGKEASHGMKWTQGADNEETAASARQLCPHCGALYTQQDYLGVWHDGRWIDQHGVWIDPECDFRNPDDTLAPVPRSVGFHIWTAYSPQADWSDIVKEHLEAEEKAAAGDKTKRKTFTNTTLGESYEEEAQQADEHALKKRAEPYPLRTCPRGVLMLTAGVDVQDRRWEIGVIGWGRGDESWIIDHMVIQGDPANAKDWERVDDYLKTRFRHASGQTLPIEAYGLDTGGHFTHEAYNFCRTRAARRAFALKGADRPGLPVKGRSSVQDVNYRGQIIKSGVRLWFVGTDTAKDLLFGRLQIERPGPGYVHVSNELPDEWFSGFTAEARVPQKVAGGEAFRWVKIRPRNEPLDCYVYATFAAHAMDLPRYTDAMWARIEERVNPMQGDLLREAVEAPAAPAQASAEAPAAPPERPEIQQDRPPIASKPAKNMGKARKNFVKSWGRLG